MKKDLMSFLEVFVMIVILVILVTVVRGYLSTRAEKTRREVVRVTNVAERLLAGDEVSLREFRQHFPNDKPFTHVATEAGIDQEAALKFFWQDNLVIRMVQTPSLGLTPDAFGSAANAPMSITDSPKRE